MFADERVAPLAPVADRAAVVDHPDGEARVDVRLHLGVPAVQVEPGGAAVDEHEDRERAARVVRRDVEAVHALAVRVLEVPRLERRVPRERGRRAAGAPRPCRRGRAAGALPARGGTRSARRGGPAPSRRSRGRSRSRRARRSRRRSGRGASGPRAGSAGAAPTRRATSPPRRPRPRGRARATGTRPVSRFQIAGRVSPSRSWSHASRWSPGTGDQQRALSDMPSSSCSPTVSPVRGSRTRSAGWMRSPCSACSRQSSAPSAESAPRRKPSASTLPRRTERSARWIRSALPPSSDT